MYIQILAKKKKYSLLFFQVNVSNFHMLTLLFWILLILYQGAKVTAVFALCESLCLKQWMRSVQCSAQARKACQKMRKANNMHSSKGYSIKNTNFLKSWVHLVFLLLWYSLKLILRTNKNWITLWIC